MKGAAFETASESSADVVEVSMDGAVLIIVDDLEDRMDNSESRCTVTDGESIDDTLVSTQALGGDVIARGVTGSCTLRAAIELANKMSHRRLVTVALRAGRFRLKSPLPEVQGTLLVVGSAGRTRGTPSGSLPTGRKGDPSLAPEDEPANHDSGHDSKEYDTQLKADAADDIDLEFDGRNPGPAAPIGTTLDGDELHQIMRCAEGARLEMRTIRLENGVAHGGVQDIADDRGRSRAGGAINSLGELRLWNVVVRDNSADNGGALYVEGATTIEMGLLERNMAKR